MSPQEELERKCKTSFSRRPSELECCLSERILHCLIAFSGPEEEDACDFPLLCLQDHLAENSHGGTRFSTDSSSLSSRSRILHPSMDSSVGGSSIVLPTVEEETPKTAALDKLPQPTEGQLGEPASEMAVRRGKNRFITGVSPSYVSQQW